MTYQPPITVRKAEVAPIVAATFPEYRGKKFRVEFREQVCLLDLNWSGGSRSQYRACTLSGEALGSSAKYNAMAPWDSRQVEGQSVAVPQGACMVRHSHFCGKDTGITITINPADAPKWIEHQNSAA
jgi:uncharacterized Fe-S cluster protein YjdI